MFDELRKFGMPFALGSPPDESGGGSPPVDSTASSTPAFGGDSAPAALDEPIEVQSDDPLEGFLADVDDEGETVPKGPAKAPAKGPKLQKPAAAATGAPVPPVKPAAVPQAPAPAAEPPQVAQAQGDQPPAPQSVSPEDFPRLLKEHKGAIIQRLAETQFALTSEEQQAFDLDPTASVPKLMARVYTEAVTTCHHLFGNIVPQLIEKVLTAKTEHEKVVDQFFGQFKGLDKSKHSQDVLQTAMLFKQNMPQIDQQSLWAMTAAAVMAKNGLVPGAQAPAQSPSSNGRGHPAQAQLQPAPFTPAMPGVSSVVSMTEDSDEFAGLLAPSVEDRMN